MKKNWLDICFLATHTQTWDEKIVFLGLRSEFSRKKVCGWSRPTVTISVKRHCCLLFQMHFLALGAPQSERSLVPLYWRGSQTSMACISKTQPVPPKQARSINSTTVKRKNKIFFWTVPLNPHSHALRSLPLLMVTPHTFLLAVLRTVSWVSYTSSSICSQFTSLVVVWVRAYRALLAVGITASPWIDHLCPSHYVDGWALHFLIYVIGYLHYDSSLGNLGFMHRTGSWERGRLEAIFITSRKLRASQFTWIHCKVYWHQGLCTLVIKSI